jgi:AcrR family transcriptional regulator
VPPPRLTRAEQQAQTRERLLAAAERVVARCGYGGASIDLISAEAGYSKGAVYSNFESKEAVFLELLRRHMEKNISELAVLMDLGADSISNALTAWLESMAANDDCTLLAVELQLHAKRNPAFASQYYALQRQSTLTLAGLLERYFIANGAPLPMDAVDLADAVTAISHGVTLQRPDPDPGRPSEAGKVIDALLRGFTTRAAGV